MVLRGGGNGGRVKTAPLVEPGLLLFSVNKCLRVAIICVSSVDLFLKVLPQAPNNMMRGPFYWLDLYASGLR